MAWDPVAQATGGKVTTVDVVTAPVTGGAQAADRNLNEGRVGKTIAKYNPLAKGPTYQAQDVQDPSWITAPSFDPNAFKGAPTVGGPKTFTGAKIGAVHDPRAALINQDPSNEWRGQQMTLAQQLAAQARGEGPSLATEQLNQAQKANQAAAFAQMASQRGGPSAGLARNTQMASAQIQGQTARDAAQARIAEQMGARQQLAGVLDSGRGQDIQLATQQAMLEQEAGLAKYKGDLERAIAQGQLDQNTASQMFQAAVGNARQNAQMSANYNQQYNDLVARYAAMGMDAASANQAAAMQVQSLRLGENAKAQQSDIAASAAQKAAVGKVLGYAGQAGMAYATGGTSLAASPAVAGAAASGGPTAPAYDYSQPYQAPAPSGYDDPNSSTYKGY